MNPFIFIIPAAYLLGATPFAMIIARAHGVDIRSVGSGNVGATNLSRACGRKWGYVCFGLDVCKGLVPMLAAGAFVEEVTAANLWLWLGTGCSAVLGHVFPVYLKFKGGKGVATSLGFLLGLFPYYTVPGGAAFVLWAALVLVFHYISLASVAAAVFFPAALAVFIALVDDYYFTQLWPLLVVAVIMAGLVVFKHRTNIKRLLDGTESKVLEKQQR